MRIKSFSEARGIFESEEFSLEPHIYCFGGGGGGGNGGSSSDSDVDAMGAAAAGADYGGSMSGSGANTAGAGAGMHGGGGGDGDSGNDSDRGGGSDSNQQDRQAYSDRFGGVSTRNFNVDKNQGFVDTDKGRVYGGSDVLGKGIAEGDITPTERQSTAIDMASQITGIDPSNIAVGGDLFFGEEDLMANQDLLSSIVGSDVPEFDEPGGAVSMYGIPGVTPPGSYASTPVTQAAIGPALGTTDYESDAYGVVGGGIAARGPANIQGTRTDTPDALSIAAARDNFRARGLDTTGNVNAITGIPLGGTGTREVDTVFDPTDFNLGIADPRTEAEQKAAMDALKAGASPVEQITSQATDPATSFAAASNLGLTDASTMAAMEDEVAQGLGSLAAAQEPSNFNFSRDVLNVDQGIPQMSLAPESRPAQVDRQFRMGEVQGPMSMAPVEATRFSGTDMMRQADDVLGQRAFDEAIFGDTSDMPPSLLRVGAEVINSLESTFGGNQARKIADVANRPGGALVRDPQSGEILGAVGPEENIRSAFMGAQDAVYVGDPRGYQQGVEVGTSILGPDTNVRAVATQDPFTGEFEGRPGADYTNRGPTDTGGGDGGGQIIPPPQEVVPEPPPEEYQGRDIVGGAPGYRPRGPLSYAYTGLPSLAPQKLQPSFQARGQYSPLFPMGQIRRRS